MKRSSKRVAAGLVALSMVPGMMPAGVGNLLAGNSGNLVKAVTAEAAKNANVSSDKKVLTKSDAECNQNEYFHSEGYEGLGVSLAPDNAIPYYAKINIVDAWDAHSDTQDALSHLHIDVSAYAMNLRDAGVNNTYSAGRPDGSTWIGLKFNAAPSPTESNAYDDILIENSKGVYESVGLIRSADLPYIKNADAGCWFGFTESQVIDAINNHGGCIWIERGIRYIKDGSLVREGFLHLRVDVNNFTLFGVASDTDTGSESSTVVLKTQNGEIVSGLSLANVTLDNLAGAVVVDKDNNVVAGTDNVYKLFTLENNNKYKIYTDKKIANTDFNETTKLFTKLKVTVANNQTYNGKTYNYCYEITVPAAEDDATDSPEYTLTHINNFLGRVPTNAKTDLWVGEDGDNGIKVAELKVDENYYYGDTPSLDDVKFTDEGKLYKDSVVKVEDIYFMKDGSIVDNDALQVGQSYDMTAYVTVDASGVKEEENNDTSDLYLKKRVKLVKRPLEKCDAYLVTEDTGLVKDVGTGKIIGGTLLEIKKDDSDNYYVDVPAYTYNGQKKAPTIQFVNRGNGEILTSANVLVETPDSSVAANKTEATNVGTYWFNVKAKDANENNYTSNIKVNWWINEAALSADDFDIQPKSGLVYDGSMLSKDDFTINVNAGSSNKTLAEKLLADKATTISEPVAVDNGGDLKSAGTHKAKITISNPNYGSIPVEIENVNIAKRPVTITPDKTNKATYGDESVLKLKADIELAKYSDSDKKILADNKGFILDKDGSVFVFANVANINDVVGGYIKVGTEKKTTNVLKETKDDLFDYTNYVNDAGTYSYAVKDRAQLKTEMIAALKVQNATMSNETAEDMVEAKLSKLDNYSFTIAAGSEFKLEKAELEDNVIYLDNSGVHEWILPVGEGSVPQYTYDGTSKLAPAYKIEESMFNDTATKKLDTYRDLEVGGYKKATLPGEYDVEFAAKEDGNYTGVVYGEWKIKGNEKYELKVNALDKVYDGEKVNLSTYFVDTDTKNPVMSNLVPKNKITVKYFDAKSFTSGEAESFVKDRTPLESAPANAGKYIAVVTASAKGYDFGTVYQVFTISQKEVSIAPEITTMQFGDKAPELTKAVITDPTQIVVGDEVNFNGSFVINGCSSNVNAKFDASVETWNMYEDFKSTNGNYKPVFDTSIKFTVTPKELDDENISSTGICIKGADGWANPNGCVTVTAVVDGKKVTLVENTDFEFVSAANTKKNGNFKVQIEGKGNYAGYAEATVDVISDVKKLINITEKESGVAINNANKGLYVKVGFENDTLAAGYSISEFGLLYHNQGKITDVSALTLENAANNSSIYKAAGKNGLNIRDYGKGVIAVGYLKIKDAAGDEIVAYTGNIGGNTYVCTESKPQAIVNPKNRAGYVKVRYDGNIYKPGFTLAEYGLIYYNDSDKNIKASDLTLEAVDNVSIFSLESKNAQNIRDLGNGVVAVGYMKIKNNKGQEAIVYTNDLGGNYSDLSKN